MPFDLRDPWKNVYLHFYILSIQEYWYIIQYQFFYSLNCIGINMGPKNRILIKTKVKGSPIKRSNLIQNKAKIIIWKRNFLEKNCHSTV